MTNATELFIELVGKIAQPVFQAKLLANVGGVEHFRLYKKLFEQGKENFAILEALGGTLAIEHLTRLLRDDNPNIRYSASVSLAQICGVKEAAYFRKFLRERNDPPLMTGALHYFGLIKDKSEIDSIQKLCQAETSDSFLRFNAAIALWKIGNLNLSVEILIELLNDTDVKIRELSVRYLGLIWETEAVEPLMKVFINNENDKNLQKAAIDALGRIKDHRVIEFLLPLLEQDDLKLQAVLALGNTENPETIDPLIKVLTTDDCFSIRGCAALALSHLQNPTAIKILRGLFENSKAPSVRMWAAIALGEMGDPTVTDFLIKLLNMDNLYEEIYVAVAGALGELERYFHKHKLEALVFTHLKAAQISEEDAVTVLDNHRKPTDVSPWMDGIPKSSAGVIEWADGNPETSPLCIPLHVPYSMDTAISVQSAGQGSG